MHSVSLEVWSFQIKKLYLSISISIKVNKANLAPCLNITKLNELILQLFSIFQVLMYQQYEIVPFKIIHPKNILFILSVHWNAENET